MGDQAVTPRTRLVTLAALVAAALALTMTFGTSQAWAGGSTSLEDLEKAGKINVNLIGGKAYARPYYAAAGTGKVTAVKSSNAKVATAKAVKITTTAHNSDGMQKKVTLYGIKINYKKACTTKISLRHNGKKHVVVVKTLKYVNPFKTFKIGNVSLKAKFDAKNIQGRDGFERVSVKPVITKNGTLSGKLSLALVKGWDMSLTFSSPDKPMTSYQYNVKTKKWQVLKYSPKAKKMVVDKSVKAVKTLKLNRAAFLQLGAQNKKTGQNVFTTPIRVMTKSAYQQEQKALRKYRERQKALQTQALSTTA